MHTNAHKWAKKRDIKMTCFLSIDNQYSKTHPFVDRKRQKTEWGRLLVGSVRMSCTCASIDNETDCKAKEGHREDGAKT
jgi:hypothetical protein